MAEQVEIADRVEHLVLHELVVVTEPVGIQHAVLVHHDGVVETAAEREALGTHALDLVHETEGPGAAHFLHVRVRREIDDNPVTRRIEGRMAEVDRELETESVVRIEPCPLVTMTHLDGLADADEALGSVLLLDAGRLDQEHEWRRAAIHDRDLRRGQVDVQVVDAETRERRHQVLDRRDAHALVLEARRQSGVLDDVRTGLDVDRLGQVDAVEHDPGARRGRTQREEHLLAGVQADAGGADDVPEGSLPEHSGGSGRCDGRGFGHGCVSRRGG